MGCPSCDVIAHSHGRSDVTLVDAPCFDRPVQLVWRKRTWRCAEASSPTKAFTEQDPDVAAPRALLTTRACWWAINQIRREHASIRGLARQFGTTWNTVWTSIEPLLKEMANDGSRFAGVKLVIFQLALQDWLAMNQWTHPTPTRRKQEEPIYRTGTVL